MSTLDSDLEVLCDDYDRLVALESLNVKDNYPAVVAIRKRWALDDVHVALESAAMMERAQFVADTEPYAGVGKAVARATGRAVKGVGRVAGKAAVAGAKASGKFAGKHSKQLALRFIDFAEAAGKEVINELKEATSKASSLERKLQKLEARLSLLGIKDTLKPVDCDTGSWTTKVCLEDKPNVKACIEFSKNLSAMDAMVNEYTVKTRTIIGKSKKVTESGLEKVGRSTNWAIKRSAGLLGIIDPFKTVKAYPWPGNVVVVEHDSGKIEWAIARDGDFGHTIKSLNLHEIGSALDAVRNIIRALRQRGTKRRSVGYTGIYDEIQRMRKELKSLEGRELRDATVRYKNALRLEDAFTTSLVRVAEGLLEWCRLSLIEVK